MEKRNNALGVMLIIVIVLLIMLIGLIAYNSKLFTINNVSTSKVETGLSNTTNPTSDIANEVKTVTVDKGICPIFDISKGKKVQEGYKYTGEINYSYGTISNASINKDGTVTVNFTSDENNKDYVVQGLSGKVIDISLGSYADGSSAYIVFLMSDGTVEISSELNDSYQSGIVKSKGKVSGLTNITRVEHVVSILDSTERQVRRLTFVAIDDKGYFYDLFTF